MFSQQNWNKFSRILLYQIIFSKKTPWWDNCSSKSQNIKKFSLQDDTRAETVKSNVDISKCVSPSKSYILVHSNRLLGTIWLFTAKWSIVNSAPKKKKKSAQKCSGKLGKSEICNFLIERFSQNHRLVEIGWMNLVQHPAHGGSPRAVCWNVQIIEP